MHSALRHWFRFGLATTATLAMASVASADPWDLATFNDDSSATLSELVHGSDEQHDLGAAGRTADTDWFRFRQAAYASYEVVVDAASGDVANVIVERIASDGTTVLQSATSIGVGRARSMRIQNATNAAVTNQFIRVRSGFCTSDCDENDVYRIRFYDTSYSIPRFNNSGTQVTVATIQNPSDYTISGTVYFWSAAGAALNSSPFTLAARALLVLSTATIVPGTSGTMTLISNGRYGDLSGKAVALEPATGFSFDTAMTPRIH